MDIETLLATYPKVRPPLDPDIERIYKKIYSDNREGNTKASSITRLMETWLHKKVAADTYQAKSRLDTLELGAGTLNQLDFEANSGSYDIVEPFEELFLGKPNLERVTNAYSDIRDVPTGANYDRVTAVATFEHITDLPDVIARVGPLLKPNGVLRIAIPSEGTIFWSLGWKLTTGMEFRLKYGLDWGNLMAHEHVNTAKEIETLADHFFSDVKVSVFGLARFLSFYQYFECKAPNLQKCANYLEDNR